MAIPLAMHVSRGQWGEFRVDNGFQTAERCDRRRSNHAAAWLVSCEWGSPIFGPGRGGGQDVAMISGAFCAAERKHLPSLLKKRNPRRLQIGANIEPFYTLTRYSVRKAVIGSMHAARQAGTNDATRAAKLSNRVAIVSMTGSQGCTLNS
jgi:hypothetical protein